MKTNLFSVPTIRTMVLMAYGLTTLTFQSCKEQLDEVTAPAQQTPQPSETERPMEVAFPGKQGIIKQGFLFGSPITYEEIDGQAIFEGDIILSPEQLSEEQNLSDGRTSLAGINNLAYRWPNNQVNYFLGTLTNPQRVKDAIAHWEKFTNLDFVEIFDTKAEHFIIFSNGPGCSSSLGRQQGPQFIYVSEYCTTGNIIHEIGHAVGLFHEQSRADRDNHVMIHWNNIKPEKQSQYKKYTDLGYNGLDHGSFDFSSIMLSPRYASSAIAINPNSPVISKADGSHYVAQPYFLSSGDIAGINDMYPAGKYLNFNVKAKDISAAPDGTAYIISKSIANDGGYAIAKQQGANWAYVDPTRGGVKVAAGPNGTVWMVNANSNVFRLVNNQWQQVPGKAKDIAINSSGTVFKISDELLADGGYRVYKWNNGSWNKVSTDKGAIALAVDSSGFVHIIDSQNRIFYYSDKWYQQPGRAIDIAFDAYGKSFYALGTNNGLYKWNGNGWTRQPGLGDHLSVGPNDDIWIINYAEDVTLRRTLKINVTKGKGPIFK